MMCRLGHRHGFTAFSALVLPWILLFITTLTSTLIANLTLAATPPASVQLANVTTNNPIEITFLNDANISLDGRVQMFLPWSMMALPEGQGLDQKQIGVWIDRKVAHIDEQYGWPALPFTEPKFMSALQPPSLPNLKTKPQLAIFPYVSATHDAIAEDEEYRVGADIAWRPNPNSPRHSIRILGLLNRMMWW